VTLLSRACVSPY